MVVHCFKRLSILLLLTSLPLWAGVGKIVALKGDAVIVRGTQDRAATLGAEIQKDDEILTQAKAKLQLLFDDNTVVTIGEDSRFRVSEFLFDESGASYRAEFGLLKGAFRTITGKIGQVAPERFRLVSKLSAIGIRGTQVLSRMAMTEDRIVCLEGDIVITNLKSLESVILHAGEYVVVTPEIEIPKVMRYTPQDIRELDRATRFSSGEEEPTDDVLLESGETELSASWSETSEAVEELYANESEQATEVTNPETIINAVHSATYTGKVAGEHFTEGIKVGDYINNADNLFRMDVNFGSDAITNGQIVAPYDDGSGTIQTDNITFVGSVNSDGSGFVLGEEEAVGDISGAGNFYGPEGEIVKGEWSYGVNVNSMLGSFEATSDTVP